MVGTIESCPHCGETYGGTILGFNDGLGAREFLCLKCKQPFVSGRMEWAEMGILGRARLVLVSLLLACVFGLAGGYVGRLLAQRYGAMPEDPPGAGFPFDFYFFVGAGAVAGLVILVQLLKLWGSARRSWQVPPPRMWARFFSFHTNMFLLFAAMIVLVGSAAYYGRDLIRHYLR